MTLSTRVALAEILMGEGDYAGAEKGFREMRELDQRC